MIPSSSAVLSPHLPNELLLELFPLLPLKSLIAARGVCLTWRDLVPLSTLSPARRALLDLYYDVIQMPYFLASREDVISALVPFDREAHIKSLEYRLNITFPDEFRLWILEWPSKAVFGMAWPAQLNQLAGSGFRRTISYFRINPTTGALLNLGDVMSIETDMGGASIDWDDQAASGPRPIIEVQDDGVGRSNWLLPESTEPELYGFMLQSEHPWGYHCRQTNMAMGWVKWLRQMPEFRTMQQSPSTSCPTEYC